MALNNEIIYKTKGIFRVNNIIESDEFTVSDNIIAGCDKWQVFIGNHGTDIYDLYFKLKDYTSKEQSRDIDFSAYIMDTNYHRLEPHFASRSQVIEGWHRFYTFVNRSLLLAQMDRYVPNNCLTIGFDITVYKPLNCTKKLRRFENSFNNKDLSDCRFVVQNEEFFASKAILSDRSQVFEHMFTTDMLEKGSNEVVIDDIEAQVFEQFLRFVYFGYSDKMDEFNEELLYVSDKYMVSELKTICGNLIYLNINSNNAFKILDLLDKYKCEDLKTKALNYIKDNKDQCLHNQWCKMVGNNETLGAQLAAHMNTYCHQNQWSSQIMSYTYMP